MIYAAILLLGSLATLRGLTGTYRFFPYVLLISASYYSVFGPMYWVEEHDGYFAGINWSASLDRASTVFAAAVALLLFSYRLSLRRARAPIYPANYDAGPRLGIYPLVFASIGLISALFVYLTAENRGALFLVAYQLSDLAIPALIFLFASGRRRLLVTGAIIAFVSYGFFTGYRYKVFLLLGPIILLLVYRSRGWVRPLIASIIIGGGLLISFSLFTLARVNFGGINLQSLEHIDPSLILYGFFAESNIVFGLCSILDVVVPDENFIYLQPLLDSALELVPRIFVPERITGDYHWTVANGLHSEEGYLSGTTYPFFGEYLLMFGYPAMIMFTIMLGFLVGWFVVKMVRTSSWGPIADGGVALIAVLFGYYYMSRGYLPQFTKAALCVLLPYFFMARGPKRKIERLNGS